MKNEPAFPQFGFVGSLPDGTEETLHTGGMTLRDYFAAKALQGLCSKENVQDDFKHLDVNQLVKQIAFDSYRMADAMLKQREIQ